MVYHQEKSKGKHNIDIGFLYGLGKGSSSADIGLQLFNRNAVYNLINGDCSPFKKPHTGVNMLMQSHTGHAMI